MTITDHISHLRDAIYRGNRQIDAMYAACDNDIGDIVRMEEYSVEFDELRRQQKVRREQLERLLKKQEKE